MVYFLWFFTNPLEWKSHRVGNDLRVDPQRFIKLCRERSTRFAITQQNTKFVILSRQAKNLFQMYIFFNLRFFDTRRMTTGRGDGQTAQYKICTLAYDFHFPLPISRRNRAAQNSVKRGAADTPSAKPVLNIHILLFHTPHPQRNGVRALCSGAVSRLPAGKEYKLEFVYLTVGANCVRPPNCHSEPIGEESRFVYFYFALLEILRFAQDDKLVVVGINLCGRAG